jgi:vitamin B12 transporter
MPTHTSLRRSAASARRLQSLFVAASALAAVTVPAARLAAQEAAPAAPAEPADAATPITLDTVVVTATRTPTAVEATAASVSLITRADLETAGYADPADALRDVPGLYYAAPGPGASAGRLLTRGTFSRHTLVLLDGRRLPEGLAGNFDIAYLPASSVERIEMVRGASSALNGGNALGGVINLLTHCATPGERLVRASAEAGSFGTVGGEVFASGADERVNASVGAAAWRTDNDRPHNALERQSARVNVGGSVTANLYADVSAIAFRSDAELPNTTAVNDRFASLETELFSVSPGLRLKTGEQLQQSLFYSVSRLELSPSGFVAGFGVPGRTFGANGTTTIDSGQLDYQADFQASDTLKLSAGASWLRTEAERFNDGTGAVPFGFTAPGVDVSRADESRAVFAQAQWEALPDLHLVAALRHEHTQDYGDHVTWRGGASWRAPGTRTLLRASYATAFAPPSVQDTATALFGNPDLQSEKGRAWEFGVEQSLPGERVTVSAVYFRNRIKDLIVYDPGTFLVQNVAELTNQGLELGVEFRASETVTLRSDYTYLDQDAENDALGLSYVGRPQHLFQNTLTWRPTQAFTGTLGVRHVRGVEEFGGAAQPDYTVVRVAAQWAFRKNVTAFARVENLLDEDYAEIPGFPANPIGAYVGLRWSL